MASGVQVTDDVVSVFQSMKVHRIQASEEEKKMRKKAVMFRISDDSKQIIVDEEKIILQGEVGENITDPYMHFVNMMPADDCRYALYDASYETRESSKKEDLVFILWAPENAPLRKKMLYASSKDAIKKKFTGIKCEWQVNALDDLKDRHCLADKLGSCVVALEGKPI